MQRRGDAHLDRQPHLVPQVVITGRGLQQQAGGRGDPEQHRDVQVAHDAPVARHAEPPHGHHRRAGAEREKEHPRRIVIEKLQAADHAVGGGDAEQLSHQVGEPDPVVMTDRAALRRAGRARGVEDVGQVAAGLVRPRGHAGPGVGAEPARLAVRGHDDFGQVGAGGLELGEQRGVRGVNHGDPGRRVAQHVTGVVAAGGRVERDQDAAAGGHGEPGHHELSPVRHHDRDPVARLDP